MRAILAAAALGLAVGLPPAAMSQSVQETARQAQPAGSGAAAELQAYALTLQQAETRLARAKSVHDAGRTESQTGAFSQERIDLMHAVRQAWRDVQQAPPAIAGTDAYRQAERQVQHDLGAISQDRQVSKEQANQAAQEVLRILSDLRGHVVSASGQAGGSMPVPAVQGGGANR